MYHARPYVMLAAVAMHQSDGQRLDRDDRALSAFLRDAFEGADSALRPVERNRFGLTQRELNILQHLATGRMNKTIAQELTISVLTVDKHVSHILSKMECKSRMEAASKAIREGII